jgi:hypothetical protein
MAENNVELTALKVGMGAATGIASGLANAAAAPQVHHAIRMGAVNTSASFFHGVTKALRHHKGIGPALGAGTALAIGHGAIGAAAGAAVVAAAPVVMVAGAVGLGIWGVTKAAKFLKL